MRSVSKQNNPRLELAEHVTSPIFFRIKYNTYNEEIRRCCMTLFLILAVTYMVAMLSLGII